MSLSRIETGLNALDNMLAGVQNAIGDLYQKLGLDMEDLSPSTGSDSASRVDSLSNQLTSSINHLEWLQGKIREFGTILDPDKDEAKYDGRVEVKEGDKRDYTTIKPV